MKVGRRFSVIGALLLVSLSGCGRGFFQQGERAPWRHEAEVRCLESGAVKVGPGTVEIKPIEGPGVCGMDFPLKVSMLGDNNAALGFADEARPPERIPTVNTTAMPRWPLRARDYTPAPRERLRWVVGPPAVNAPAVTSSAGAPLPIAAPNAALAPSSGPAPRQYARAPLPRALPSDIPPDAIIPAGGSAAVPEGPPPRDAAAPRRQAYNVPGYEPPPLGSPRNYTPVVLPKAELTPPATLSCPIVSALDRWVSDGVQPAALHWFGSPVVSIKQIGSYACRDMIGARGNHISEHAFGDALDIAGFTLANGRTISVKDGWHGTPREQGFLHDVQLYACETFTTVLAPGYNPEHYNHIHVDLMRRRPGYHPCRPRAIPGEIVAARVRARYAKRQMPAYTGSIAAQLDQKRKADRSPTALPGADGYVTDDDVAANDKHRTAMQPSPLPSKPAAYDAARSRDVLSGIY